MPIPTENRKILIMCLVDPDRNPRPRRMIELCKSLGFRVAVMSYPISKKFGIDNHFSIQRPSPKVAHKIARRIYGLLARWIRVPFFQRYIEERRFGFLHMREVLKGKLFDVIIVEDLFLLPLAFDIKNEGKVLFDAREFYTRQNEGNLWFDWIERPRREALCNTCLKKCDSIITVSDGLKSAYEKAFGVSVEVIRSTPEYQNFLPQKTDPERIRMVYHGRANANRKLENLIRILNLLDDRFELDFILVGNKHYQQKLIKMAKRISKVHFKKPVPFESIIPTIAEYDIGFFYCEPSTFNLKYCLPNKFFEYIQARLMLAIGPSPDMAKLVQQYRCGVVAKEFTIEAMAAALNALDAKTIDEYKKNSHLAAQELCFEKEREKLGNILKRLISCKR